MSAFYTLGKEGDLAFLYETQAVKWQRWGSSYARRVTTTTHAIVVDTTKQIAWHQTYTVDVKYPRKRNDPYRKTVTVSILNPPVPLDYAATKIAFYRLDTLGYHDLDHKQLTSTSGPVNEDGLVSTHSFSHITNTWTYIKARNRWYSIVAYAPTMMYEKYPDFYPDRGKWLEGYLAMRALTR